MRSKYGAKWEGQNFGTTEKKVFEKSFLKEI